VFGPLERYEALNPGKTSLTEAELARLDRGILAFLDDE
jgi:hypothetical protein